MDRPNLSVPFRFRSGALLRCIAVAALAVVMLPQMTRAQPAGQNSYAKIPIPPNFSSADERSVEQMLRAGTIREPQSLLDTYIKKRIAEFTQPEYASRLPDLRVNLKRKLGYADRAGQDAHSKTNDLLLAYLPRVASLDAYHPAARYNWMLMLGELDAKEPDARGLGAQPLPAALAPMLTALKDSTSDAVRVAALVGILRHAESGQQGADLNTTAQAITEFLAQLEQDQQQGSAGRAAKGKAWMEMRAVDVLGALRVANADVVTALSIRVADTDAPVWLRCAAARALGKLDASANVPVDSEQLAGGFDNLLLTILDRQSDPRSLRWSLECVKEGLAAGPATKIAAPHDEKAKKWTAGIATIMPLFEDTKLRSDQDLLAQSVKDKIADVAGIGGSVDAVPLDTPPDTPPDAVDPPATGDPPIPKPFDPFAPP